MKKFLFLAILLVFSTTLFATAAQTATACIVGAQNTATTGVTSKNQTATPASANATATPGIANAKSTATALVLLAQQTATPAILHARQTATPAILGAQQTATVVGSYANATATLNITWPQATATKGANDSIAIATVQNTPPWTAFMTSTAVVLLASYVSTSQTADVNFKATQTPINATYNSATYTVDTTYKGVTRSVDAAYVAAVNVVDTAYAGITQSVDAEYVLDTAIVRATATAAIVVIRAAATVNCNTCDAIASYTATLSPTTTPTIGMTVSSYGGNAVGVNFNAITKEFAGSVRINSTPVYTLQSGNTSAYLPIPPGKSVIDVVKAWRNLTTIDCLTNTSNTATIYNTGNLSINDLKSKLNSASLLSTETITATCNTGYSAVTCYAVDKVIFRIKGVAVTATRFELWTGGTALGGGTLSDMSYVTAAGVFEMIPPSGMIIIPGGTFIKVSVAATGANDSKTFLWNIANLTDLQTVMP